MVIKDRPAANLTVRMAYFEDGGATHRLPEVGKKQIFTYVKVVTIIVNSYAPDSPTAKAALEIASLENTPLETSVQFEDVLRTKMARCENIYPEKRTKKLFIDWFLASIQSAIGIL